MSVEYRVEGSVAVLSLNQPPVNSLGLKLRTDLYRHYLQAYADDAVKAIVLTSATKVFSAGADITEFGTDQSFASPSLPELCCLLEASDKLVIAAIHGGALGGGLELALAADYRIASAGAKLGLPEVTLGIIPGAGGTQRLPRIVGVPLALDMVTGGVAISAAQAHQCGLIDRLVESDESLLDDAIAYATALIEQRAPLRNCGDHAVDVSELNDNYFDDYRQALSKKSRGFVAPDKAAQAVWAATHLSLEEGLKTEGQIFQECAATPEARAQQHLFFAERASTVLPGVDRQTALRDIETVAVIGAGTMGGGIAMNFANAGIPVKLLELKPELLEQGLGRIRQNYEQSVKRGRLSTDQLEQRMALLQGTTDYSDLRDADLVIEAVFESMDVKKQVFLQLDAVCKTGCILATNTSTLDVNEIAAVTARPQDVLGLHFFSPANVMKLLEVIRADKTADDVLMTTVKLAKRIKKVPVVVGVCYGFVGNRMVAPYSREAFRVLLEGATPEQSDLALTNFGLAMGAVSMADMAGIDVGCMAAEANIDSWRDDPTYQALQFKLRDLGRLGQKTGQGVYRYEGRVKHSDPEVVELARAIAQDHAIAARDISEQEIVDRTILMLVNEGARILQEGIAYRSSDIDLIYVYGYGFPAYRGGPMQYADEIGLDVVLEKLNNLRQQLGAYGERWFTPAPLLQQLLDAGKSFKDF